MIQNHNRKMFLRNGRCLAISLCLLLACAGIRAQDSIPADTMGLLSTQHLNSPVVPEHFIADSVWAEAARDYQAGRFDQALEKYRVLERNNLISADLYYNIGNVCFRNSDIKQAILYYERASRLDPRNEDIKYNLELANTYITDRIEAVDELFLVTWLKKAGNLFALTRWCRLNILFFALTLLSVTVFLLSRIGPRKYISFWLGCIFFILTLCTFAGALYQYRRVTDQREAIVFSASVTVKSSPNESGNNLFILHEGTKVRIEDTVGDWCEIRLRDGNKGWLPRTALEII
ncbi:MAG: tetratricopeptide repeat protein [Bacteroidales bacterium]|nr:tetratricopeptide repeat protein [Bacteroidales bacterium]